MARRARNSIHGLCNMQMDGRTRRAPRRLPPVFEITDGNLVWRLAT